MIKRYILKLLKDERDQTDKLFLCDTVIPVGSEFTIVRPDCIWGAYGDKATLIDNKPRTGKCEVQTVKGVVYRPEADIDWIQLQHLTAVIPIAEVSEYCKWAKEDMRFDEDDYICKHTSDDKRNKHLEEGDAVIIKIKDTHYQYEGTLKEICAEDMNEWWDTKMIITNVKEQIGYDEDYLENQGELRYLYKNCSDITIERREVEFKPSRYIEAYLKCPTCNRMES